MKLLKNYITNIGITIFLLLIFAIFITILNYFDLLNTKFYKGLLTFASIISIATGSYILGKNSKNKGYLNGIIFGIIISIIFMIISIILNKNISLPSFIYYLIIIITSGISSTIGINKKATDKQ